MNLLNVKKVNVFYKNRLVGVLLDNGDLTTSFSYSDEWISNGFSISPFKLPLENKVFTCTDQYVNFMFGVFCDCLPDSWGNLLLDKYLSKKGINPSKVTILQRLCLLDKYSLGALSFKPSVFEESVLNEYVDYDEIFTNINEIIKCVDIENNHINYSIIHSGSSTGGSRPKINALINNEVYIVKFPSNIDPIDIGYNEYKLNLLAKECGMNVPDCLLLNSFKSKGYFATKRFDINKGNKSHVISLAGLFDLNTTLSQIHYLGFLQTVRALCPDDLEEAIKRMIFNYLVDNKDDHPRNFSFIYNEDEKRYRLSPFFDITSTPDIPYHAMNVNNNEKPTINDFVIICKKVGVNENKVKEIYNSIKEKISIH